MFTSHSEILPCTGIAFSVSSTFFFRNKATVMSFFYPRKALTALQTSWPSFPSGNCLFSPRGWGGHFWDRFCIKIALNSVRSQTLDRGHKNGRLDVMGKPRMGRRERQWQRQTSVIRLVKRGKIIRLHVQPAFKYISLTRSPKWRRKFFQISGSCYNLSPQQLIRHSPPSHECIYSDCAC